MIFGPISNFARSLQAAPLKTYSDCISSLLDSTTNPDLSTLGKRFWSFIKSMKKDKVGICPLKKNGKGEAVHDGRKKADLL